MSDFTPPRGTPQLPWQATPPAPETAKRAISEGPSYTPPAGTEETFRKDYQRVGDLYSAAYSGPDDPEETLAKASTSVYLADRLGVPAESIYKNYDVYAKSYWGQINPPKKNLEAVRAEFRIAQLQNQMSDLYWDFAHSSGPQAAELWGKIEELRAKMPSQDEIKRSLPVSMLKGAASLLPQIIDSMSVGMATGLAAAGTAALAGQLGPQIALPEELITMPLAGISAAVAAGSAVRAGRLEAGSSIGGMIDAGVNPDVARAFSYPVYILNGLIETMQLRTILKGMPSAEQVAEKAIRALSRNAAAMPTLRKKALAAAARFGIPYVGNVAGETGQELVQESWSLVNEELAKQVSNAVAGTDLDPATAGEIVSRLGQVVDQSLRGFSMIGLPGSMVQGAKRVQAGARFDEARADLAQRIDRAVKFTDPTRTAEEKAASIEERIQELTTIQKDLAPKVALEGITEIDDKMAKSIREFRDNENELTALGLMKNERRAQDPAAVWRKTAAEITEAPTAPPAPAVAEVVQREQAPEQLNIERDVLSPEAEFRQIVSELSPGMDEREVDGLGLITSALAYVEDLPYRTWLRSHFAPQIAERAELPPGKRGAFDVGRKLILITANSDFSTWAHEIGHGVFTAMSEDRLAPAAEWAGALKADGTVVWDEAAHEKLAGAWVRFLHEGQAPTPELQTVFERMTQWLVEAYEVISGKFEVNDDIRTWMGTLLTKPESGVGQAAAQTQGTTAQVAPQAQRARAEEAPIAPAAVAPAPMSEMEQLLGMELPEMGAPIQTPVADIVQAEIMAPELARPEPAATTTIIDPDDAPIMDLPVSKLSLSKEVPNFKEGAAETGVVEPLAGARYVRLGTAPIVVWERRGGGLEVITGRHRLDLARRTGQEILRAFVVREADGFTAAMAMTFDAESNIRDGQGSTRDYANYFRHSKGDAEGGGISEEQASSRGLLDRDKGRKGWNIGQNASDGLYALYRNAQIGEEKAAAIAAAAPKNERLQDLGILKAKELNADELANYLNILKIQVGTSEATQGDLFGRDESALIEAATMAREASKKMGELRSEYSALRGALRLSKGDQAKVVEKYGFKSGDREAVQARITQLEEEIEAWTGWTTDPAKHEELRRRSGLLPLLFQEDIEGLNRFFGDTEGGQILYQTDPTERPEHASDIARIKEEISRVTTRIREVQSGKQEAGYAREVAEPLERYVVALQKATDKGLMFMDPADQKWQMIIHKSTKPEDGVGVWRTTVLFGGMPTGHRIGSLVDLIEEQTGDGNVVVESRGLPLLGEPQRVTVRPDILYQPATEQWYLRSQRTIQTKMAGPMPGRQILKMLQNAGIKEDELRWTGLSAYLDTDEKRSPQAVLEQIQSEAPVLDEVQKGEQWKGLGEQPKFKQWMLPGGENYRELLLRLPYEEPIADVDDMPREVIPGHEQALADLQRQIEDVHHSLMQSPFDQRDELFEMRNGLEFQLDLHTRPVPPPPIPAARTIGPYEGPHWEEANVLVHARFDNRLDSEGRRVLFVEEIQSDWHQEGREKGYAGAFTAEEEARSRELWRERPVNPDAIEAWEQTPHGREYLALGEKGNKTGVPDAPFRKTWHELMFRRMLRWAAENDFDVLAWTTGEQQAERYDLSKQVDRIDYRKNADGTYDLVAVRGQEPIIDKTDLTELQLSELVGKEMAAKIAAGEGQPRTIPPTWLVVEEPEGRGWTVYNSEEEPQAHGPTREAAVGEAIQLFATATTSLGEVRSLSGLDLKVGGEGMKGFYDKILVDYAKKYGKQWGAKVGEAAIAGQDYPIARSGGGWGVRNRITDYFIIEDVSREEAEAKAALLSSVSVHSLDITPQMRESVMEGQTLFQPEADAHEKAVQEAVNDGMPVPDRVLDSYKDRAWAIKEIARRERLIDYARQSENADEFILWMVNTDGERSATETYYRAIYETAKRRPADPQAAAERMLEALDEKAVTSIMAEIQSIERDNVESKLLTSLTAEMAALGKAALAGKVPEGLAATVRQQLVTDALHWRELLVDHLRQQQDGTGALPGAFRAIADIIAAREAEVASKPPLQAMEWSGRTLEDLEKAAAARETELRKARGYVLAATMRVRQYSAKVGPGDATSPEARAYKRQLAILDERIRAEREAHRDALIARSMVDEGNRLYATIFRPVNAAIAVGEGRRVEEIQSKLYWSPENVDRGMLSRIKEWRRRNPNAPIQSDLVEEIDRRNPRQITMEELEQVAVEIRELRRLGREKREEQLEVERMFVEGQIDLAMEALGPPAAEQQILGTQESRQRRLTGKVKRFYWGTLRMNRLSDIMESGKKYAGMNKQALEMLASQMKIPAETLKQAGPFSAWMWTAVNEATDNMIKQIRRVQTAHQAKLEELGLKPNMMGKVESFDGHALTHGEMIGVYIYRQFEDGRFSLQTDNNISAATATMIVNALSKEERAYGDFLIDTLSADQDFDRMLDAQIVFNNSWMERVGRYFPYQRSDVGGGPFMSELVKELLDSRGFSRRPRAPGFLKSRLERREGVKFGALRLDAPAVFASHLQKREYFIAHAELLKRLKRIFDNREVRAALTDKFGDAMPGLVGSHLGAVMNDDIYRTHEDYAQFGRVARTVVSGSLISWNLMTLARNLIDIPMIMVQAGPLDALVASGKLMSHPVETMKFVLENAPQLADRSYDRFVEELKQMDRNAYERVLKKVGETGFMALYATDMVSSSIGWLAIYNRTMRQTGNHEAATRAARDFILSHRPAARAKDLAQIYRNPGLMSWLLMFSNQLNQQWNILSYDIPVAVGRAFRGDTSGLLRAARESTAFVIAAVAMAMVERKRLPEGEEIPKDVLAYIFGNVPFIGQALENLIRGDRGYQPLSPLQGITDAASHIKQLTAPADEEQRARAAVNLIFDAMRATGLPAVQARRVYKTAETGDPWHLFGGPPKAVGE